MIIYGKQPVLYLIEHHSEKIKSIYLAKEVDRRLFSTIQSKNIKVIRPDSKKAQAMAHGGNHQGFLAEVEDIETLSLQSQKDSNFVVILNDITDMGNIGAIVRSAYALGVDALIITGINRVGFEGIMRTSSGALFDLPIVHHINLYDVLNELKQWNFTLYGATLDGEDARKISFEGKRALVLGNESEGIPTRALKKIDKRLSIVMRRPFDSLNVSAAGAILIDRMR